MLRLSEAEAARASLENAVAKRLAAAEKAKGAAAAGAAAEVVVEQCDAAAAAGETSVVEVGAGVGGKAVGKLAKKIHKAHPGLAFVVAGGGKVGAFAAVPEGHALAPAGAWLNAALEPLGGRGGGAPTFAQGSAKGDDASAVMAAAKAFRSVKLLVANAVRELLAAFPVGGGAATARSTSAIRPSVSTGGPRPW